MPPQWEHTSFPPSSHLLHDLPLLAVDVETTGLNPKKDVMVSIGWVPINGRTIDLSQAAELIIQGAPGFSVGSSATIHYFTDEQLASGVSLDKAMDELLTALAGRVLLAHFSHIEQQFLARACQKVYRASFQPPVVDTFALERRRMERMGTYPRGEDLRLPRVRERYGLPRYPNHSALHDALACAELYLAQTVDANSRGKVLGDLRH
nr:exonuclease domain-containing protein [Corynebacterium poyangense]